MQFLICIVPIFSILNILWSSHVAGYFEVLAHMPGYCDLRNDLHYH